MNHSPHNPAHIATTPDGPEKWVPAAIAQQEEHLKRCASCRGTLGTQHAYRTFGVPGPDGTIAQAVTYQACIVCGVTATDSDYQTRLNARRPNT